MDRKSQLLQFLQDQPTSSFLLFALAKEYENEKNPDLAIETYTKLLDNEPNYTGAYYHLGKQYVAKNDFNAAREVFLKGIDICHAIKAMHDASELRSALDDIEE